MSGSESFKIFPEAAAWLSGPLEAQTTPSRSNMQSGVHA